MDCDDRQAENETLLDEAMPAILSIAREVHGQHPPSRNMVSYEDLVSEGVLGALRAAENYDPGLGTFSNFARKSIHGHMVEMHRRRRLEQNLMLGAGAMSYTEAAGSNSACLWDGAERPDQILEAKECEDIVSDAVDNLPQRHALVLHQIFYDDALLKDVAKALNVCTSRVSQIKFNALDEMRSLLAERGIEDYEACGRASLPSRLM
jgi:RNA polymerase sigma factor (sigma-70 family)